MLGLYLAGFVAAFTTARLLKSSILKSSDTPFILELPQYRMPTFYSLGLRLLDRARIFMKTRGHYHRCRIACTLGAGADSGRFIFKAVPTAPPNWPTA